MKRRVCEYCETEYDKALPQCPHCGFFAEEKRREPIPQWMWIMICAFLAMALLIGFAYFLFSMDYVGQQEEVAAPPPVTEPVEVVPVVDPMACTDLTLSREAFVIEEQGARVFLSVMPEPAGCPEDVTFESSDPSVATVSASGMITAVEEGQAEILVTCGDVQKVCTVVCDFPEPEVPEEPAEETPELQPEDTEEEPEAPEVPEEPEEQKPAEAPTLSSEDFTLFRPGEETTLTVKDAPAGATISYVSSDSSVASVTETGLVTAVGNGTATITVKVNDLQLTCIARCKLEETTENNTGAAQQPAGNYAISHEDVTCFRSGEVFYLSLRDEANNKAAGLSWASQNTTVCTVDANGKVTATGKGTTTVSTVYGGKTYSCIVRCSF